LQDHDRLCLFYFLQFLLTDHAVLILSLVDFGFAEGFELR